MFFIAYKLFPFMTTSPKRVFIEVTENLATIRKHLKSITRSAAEQVKSNRSDGRGGSQPEVGSVRNIYDWLNKNGDPKEQI